MKTLLILKNGDYKAPLYGKQSATPKWSYFCLAVLFTFFFSGKIHAQIIQDIGGISVTSHSKTAFKDLPTESPDSENKFRLNTYDAWIPIPHVKIGKTSIFGNLNYRLMDFNYDNNSIEDPNRLKRIQEIKPTIIIRHPISEKWSVLAIAMPALAGEKSVSFDNLVLDGILGVSKKFGPESNFEIGVGVHALHSFGETLITPGISIDYRSTNNKWLAQFYWPRLNVLYNISQNTQIGLAGSIDWTRFKLKSFRGYNGKEADYAQFSTIHGGLQLNQRIAGGIWLQVQGGAGLFNSYELFDINQKTVNNFSVSNMAYGKVTLTYRIGKK
ncbi:DUF6268 family outer membrane beta-barrel protein [Elizabethkingia sp. HX WHF]|uniref:DUF6268 family outer membrane beta-barrel protein n=1 Tax=Elizabethkingia TaxID=308865 RepID=UPI00099A555A|nr:MULTISPECIES: DUF6268 family outer membrane beta-barrel protein [Elizabethkingia]ATL43532.1 hypothetical protein CQS02_09595 [Elizabethkingia miricola]MCL1638374.1 DUF6268 family outer membrane beta-barrel protein [Elizabethkingia bruuniana]MDX8564598.1 DUF6268 family outer membrane beta-barrel protein [Elizabethkingia sp. HX WHF]OPC26375.1 hypothetical protein BAY00_03495 [Elizabethkingia bruuniana]